MRYNTPSNYFYRIHHIRPRFKRNCEDVLFFLANQICSIEPQENSIFQQNLFNLIRRYPGNANKSIKTINNWRTELCALFSFIQYREDGQIAYPGRIATLLSQNQDMSEFFRYFLLSFQYPGGFLKPEEINDYIQHNIRFKPVKTILLLLQYGENQTGQRFGISKKEAAHCIFNDLRVTTNQIESEEIFDLLQSNRTQELTYDARGDVTRYAGDILDYMILANLLVKRPNNLYYLNNTYQHFADVYIQDNVYFDGFDHYYQQRSNIDIDHIEILNWFDYVNQRVENFDFATTLQDLIPEDTTAVGESIADFIGTISGNVDLTTTDIGNLGESIALYYEQERLRRDGREDLIGLVQRIPSHLAVGYDINSRNSDASMRRIEVKTSISSTRTNNFTLTKNEWNVANSELDSYFIYRIILNSSQGVSESPQLYIMQNPKHQYCSGNLNMEIISNGANITIVSPDIAGRWESVIYE